MKFDRTDHHTLEEYSLTATQLRAIGGYPGNYFGSLITELESYKNMSDELADDQILILSICLEFVPGYPAEMQRVFRGAFCISQRL